MLRFTLSPFKGKLEEQVKHLSDHEKSAIEDIKKEGLFGENFLDVGCGKGNLVFELAKIGKMCIGIDISRVNIYYSMKGRRSANVHFVLADAVQLPFKENSFKVVTAIDVIEHLSSYEKFIFECKRILKAHGLMYIHTPNRLQTNLRKKLTRWKGWCKDHVHEFSPSELIELLKIRGFRSVTILRLDGLWMLRLFPSIISETCSKALKRFPFMYDGFHLKVKK